METLLGIAIGIGLSAACGFRVFVPLLVMNLMALGGYLHLSPGFAWIGSHYATMAFATATILEVIGYYVPWVDHLLDIVATPAAVIAGTVATASMVVDLSPFLKWTLSLIAGGGIAGLVQGTTSALRVKSSLSTAGCRQSRNFHTGTHRIDYHGSAGYPCPGSLPHSHWIVLFFRSSESGQVHIPKNEISVTRQENLQDI